MADHEKIYGICENKCQHEVYKKDDVDSTFLKKSDASNSYAIKSHATSQTTYGRGTLNLYGHVRIDTSLTVPENATLGVALAASAGKELNDKISALESRIQALEDAQ